MAKVSTTTTGPKVPIKLPKITREPRKHFEWQMPQAPRVTGVPVSQDAPECEAILGGDYNPKGQAGVKKTGSDK
jgi:hypothetical protein